MLNRSLSQKKFWGILCLLLTFILGTVSCNQTSQAASSGTQLETKTGYHAVFMMNNMILFGKLTGMHDAHPILTDVYYLRTEMNPESKQVSNRFVKRGSEFHGPDKMMLNAEHILFVEPVGPGSRIAEMIKKQGGTITN